MSEKGTRRSNGEGSIYEFTQKVKKNNKGLEVCNICKNCKEWFICDNRENCKTKCDKCKNCKECFNYCDRYYVYDRHAQQCTTKDGKRTTAQYGKKKKEVAQKNLEIINKINNNFVIDKSEITLYDIAKDIVEDRHNKNITNDNSYIANLAKLNRLNVHAFMHKPAQKVVDDDLHKYLNYMTIYSDSVIGKDYGLLNATFIRAVKKGVLNFNPLDDKDEFRKPKSKIKNEKVRAFKISEQKKFIDCIKNVKKNKYEYAWLLMLNIGLRPGEIFALDIEEDIDLENKKIHVRNSLSHSKNGNTILGDRTKTYSGDRYIDMNRDTIAIIEEAIISSTPNKYNLLFWDKKRNSFMSVSASNSSFKRFCQKNNIGKGFDETQYVLRHSCATRKIESGTPAEVLKDFLGHKDISVTLNTYFDAFAEYKNKYNKLSEQYINGLGLCYIDLTEDEKIYLELDNLSEVINNSIFDDIDKNLFYALFEKIRNKYSIKKEIC